MESLFAADPGHEAVHSLHPEPYSEGLPLHQFIEKKEIHCNSFGQKVGYIFRAVHCGYGGVKLGWVSPSIYHVNAMRDLCTLPRKSLIY